MDHHSGTRHRLSNTLDIPGDFSTQVSTGIPIEIVDAENQGLSTDRQNASTEDMDITVDAEQPLDSTQLSMVAEGTINMPTLAPASGPNTPEMSTLGLQGSVSSPAKTTVNGMEIDSIVPTHSTPLVRQSEIEKSGSIDPLTSSHALEISADAIPTLGIDSHSSDVAVSRPRQMIGKYGIRLSPTSMLNEPTTPTSSEEEFDTSELLNQSLLQQDEVTQRLAQAGPIGVAAAAAILSSRKRKRLHSFETNPSLRKRHCSKLTKRLKESIEELSARVGLQACIVTFRPGKPESKSEPTFKVHGAAPLCNVIRDLQNTIVAEMNATLHQQAPQAVQPKPLVGETLHDLPPLIFDGIPTPVHKMTQAQLRTFIPVMLKASTGRGKPGWGKDAVKPTWWPAEVPWANVRSDIRDETQKKTLAWTDALRRIVLSCYLHHGRIDLLPEFTLEQLQELLSPEAAEQLQVQLESLQQQQQQQQTEGTGILSGVTSAPTDTTTATLASRPGQLGVDDSQQVFTVDTGMGNCDTSGMPTLADASLAETASRLQQVADESGEVQYATQTVTVTDRDAKALGQPVGSTTTVLLTAYPGGHNGNPSSATGEGAPQDSNAGQSFLTTQTNPVTGNAPNIQVVYNASQVDGLVSSESSSVTNTGSFSVSTATSISGSVPTNEDISVSVGNEYLTAAASQELLEATSNISTIPNQGDDGSTDLATQLINQYTAGVAGVEGGGFVLGSTKRNGSHLMGSTSAELAPLEGDQAKTSET